MNHPGTFTLVGTSTVPSAFRPSWVSHTERPMAGIRTAIGTLARPRPRAGDGRRRHEHERATVAARAEDTGRCVDRAGQGVAVLLEPGDQAPRTREKEQCGQYQQRSRDVLVAPMEGSSHPSRPRDYERWFWRDANHRCAPATNGQDHRESRCRRARRRPRTRGLGSSRERRRRIQFAGLPSE